jgi:aminoglycoside phosphotransferase (APT) family kinase protein
MERVDGPPLMTVLARSPWKLFSVARMQGALHARLHGVMAPPALPELRGFLRERIERAEALPQSLAAFSLELLDTLPGGDRLCHGDFHVGNILVGPGGPVVIDWTLAARGDPDGDVGRSVMLIRLGEVPPGTPATIRVGRRFGQGLFLRAYERAYRGHRTVDEAAVGRWEIVNAAARFEERIESEYPALERLIESRMHR